MCTRPVSGARAIKAAAAAAFPAWQACTEDDRTWNMMLGHSRLQQWKQCGLSPWWFAPCGGKFRQCQFRATQLQSAPPSPPVFACECEPPCCKRHQTRPRVFWACPLEARKTYHLCFQDSGTDTLMTIEVFCHVFAFCICVVFWSFRLSF